MQCMRGRKSYGRQAQARPLQPRLQNITREVSLSIRQWLWSLVVGVPPKKIRRALSPGIDVPGVVHGINMHERAEQRQSLWPAAADPQPHSQG